MRARLFVPLLVGALVLPGPATAAELYETVELSPGEEWAEGRFVAGLPRVVDGVNARAWPILVGDCHRGVTFDLFWTPSNATVAAGPGSVTLDFTFRGEVVKEGVVVRSVDIRQPGWGYGTDLLPTGGAYEVRLVMLQGAMIDWSLRVRARAAQGELACRDRILLNEVEANPDGADAGAEWVELANPNAVDVDVSLWVLTATHGTPSTLTLPPGTIVPAGGVLRVDLGPGQFLDNVDEVLVLDDGLGTVMDTTPPLTDRADDARTWSRVPDATGPWVFQKGTPGSPNA